MAEIPQTVQLRLDEAEDFRADMAQQAFCAPDADYDTIRQSLTARIADAVQAGRAAAAADIEADATPGPRKHVGEVARDWLLRAAQIARGDNQEVPNAD